MPPHAVERFGHDPGIVQGLVKQFRAGAQHSLRDVERFGGMPLLNLLSEAILEVWLVLETREMHRNSLGKRAHPVDRHHLDTAPGAERLLVEFRRQAHEMGGFGVEEMAQLTRFSKFLITEQTLCANAEKSFGELIMMHVAIREPVIVYKYSELAFAQRRAVEMGQMINCSAGGVHRRLVDQMDLAQQLRVARHCAGQTGHAAKEWHSRRSVVRQHRGDKVRQVFYRRRSRYDISWDHVSRLVALSHWNSSSA